MNATIFARLVDKDAVCALAIEAEPLADTASMLASNITPILFASLHILVTFLCKELYPTELVLSPEWAEVLVVQSYV